MSDLFIYLVLVHMLLDNLVSINKRKNIFLLLVYICPYIELLFVHHLSYILFIAFLLKPTEQVYSRPLPRPLDSSNNLPASWVRVRAMMATVGYAGLCQTL